MPNDFLLIYTFLNKKYVDLNFPCQQTGIHYLFENFHFATYFPLQPLNTLDAGRIEINAHLATQGYYDN